MNVWARVVIQFKPAHCLSCQASLGALWIVGSALACECSFTSMQSGAGEVER